jgi:hypothetical protein
MNKKLAVLCMAVALAGCVEMQIDNAISKYEAVAGQVELGDSRDKVMAILQSTQEGLPKSSRKAPERYIKDRVNVEIYYMRSARQPDGLTTDDDFVPYLFNDGKLVGIGWQVLGGPKTQGQSKSHTYISNQNTTIVY